MSKTANRTKAHIVKAAIRLFARQGFGSTSIREISEAAQVNSASISYHFKNKQGILEWIMVEYFEGLFRRLESLRMGQDAGSKERADCFSELMTAVDMVIGYQCDNMEVSTIIQRELSVDSMLVREVMSTYIAKLKFYFTALLEWGVESKEFRQDLDSDMDMQLIQMMSSMFFPYFNPQIIREVFYVEPTSNEYRQLYVSYLSKIWGNQLKI